MVGWEEFFRGLPRILFALSAIYPPAHEWPLGAWEESANRFFSEVGQSCRRITPRPPRPSASGAVQKAILQYPVYGALTITQRSQNESGIRILQGLLLALQAKHLERKNYSPQIVLLGRVIRHCAFATSDYIPTAFGLPRHVDSLDDLKRQISTRVVGSKSLDDHRSWILTAIDIVGKPSAPSVAVGIPSTRITSLVVQRKTRTQQTKPVDDGTDSRPFPAVPSGGILEAGDLQGGIDDRTEMAERHAFAEGRAASPGKALPSFQADLDHAKAVQRAIARANQRLPAEWRLPTPRDISVLLTAMQEAETNDLAPEVRLALCLMLVCGSAGITLRVVSVIDQFPVERDLITVGLLDRVWARSLPVPTDAYQPTASDKAHLDPVDDVLRLPAPAMLISAAAALLPSGGSFLASDQNLKDIRDWLGELNRAKGTRLTIGRIGRSLQWGLHSVSDDAVEVAMLTGDVDDCRHSGLYYYSPKSAQLVSLYISAWNRLVETAATNVDRLDAHGDQTRSLANAPRVGTPLHPSAAALQGFVAAMKQWIIDKPPRLRSRRELASYHNRYTVYTATLLQFATGGRPVRAFFARQQDVQFDTCSAILSDKDYLDARSTRLVPLPTVVMEQLKHYRQHVTTLRKRMPLVRLPSDSSESALLFLINAEGKPRDIVPKDLSRYRKAFWELPQNTHRHWYRTALREAGVSAEVVDSVMGHARYMQGTYDPFSALAPADLAEVLAPAIQELLTTMGWEALRGLYG